MRWNQGYFIWQHLRMRDPLSHLSKVEKLLSISYPSLHSSGYFLKCVCTRHYTNRNILKLHERGVFNDIFPASCPELPDLLNSRPQFVYSGFDPTADSLHVGNLLVLLVLLHCQRAGHNILALIGGATAQVGDPSGRREERPELHKDDVEKNTKKITECITRIFHNHEELFWKMKGSESQLQPLKIINNKDWYNNKTVLGFLTGTGRHFRVGQMLTKQSVKSRLDSNIGLSLTEFIYQALQAYDWLHLYQKYKCTIQIGGSDQMGNIVLGHELISRMLDQKVYGITVPLIKAESGNKYGKSAGNAVWLDPEKTSPFEFYQFFVRRKDDEVEELLKLFTFYSLHDVEEIMIKHREKSEKRHAQKKLAENITELVHGEEGLKSAMKTTNALYNGTLDSLVVLSEQELQQVFHGASYVELLLEAGTTVSDMAMKTGCFKFEVDCTRIITVGGFYVNQQKITNPEEVIVPGIHILPNNLTLIRVGKRNFYIVKWLK